MRVLHVIPALGLAYAGPANAVLGLAKSLVKAGVNVHIAAANGEDKNRVNIPLGVPRENHGVCTYYFPQPFQTSYAFSWPLTSWLRRNLRKYDLVHINSLFAYPTFVASRIAIRHQCPYVVSPHGMLEPWALQYKAWKKSPYLRFVEGTTLRKAAAIQALTLEEADYFRTLNIGAPTFVLPNGVNSDEFSPILGREAFEDRYPLTRGKSIILFLGRIDPKKGLDLLVAAFGKIAHKGLRGRVCLVIAGPDLVGYQNTIEHLIHKEGLYGDVLFTGGLYGDARLAALSAADIFVLPSRSEGFSVAVLEALACGCPVILTEACNFPRVKEVRAGEIISLDVQELTQSLLRLLSDKALRALMGAQGRELVQNEFSWQAIGNKMSQIYQDIFNRDKTSTAWVV